MDIATLAGTAIGVAMVLFGVISDSNFTMLPGYANISAVIITVCGSLTSLLVSYAMKDFLRGFGAFGKALGKNRQNHREIVEHMMELSNIAYREGILALEATADSEKDVFLKKGILMIVDGAEQTTVRTVLKTDLKSMNERHQYAINFVKNWATQIQAWGMIGTLIGFVRVLMNLETLVGAGAAMATALLPIIYGSLIAYLVCIPAANKLEMKNYMETLGREVMIEALLAIQMGENPRITEEKLKAFLPASDRKNSVESDYEKDTFIR